MGRSGMCRLLLVPLCAAGCASPSAFTCEQASDCVDGSLFGTCQPDGFCSFPDADCPGGQRYGDHSGANAGQCVAGGDDTSAAMTLSSSATGSGEVGSAGDATSTTEAVDSATSEPATDSAASSGATSVTSVGTDTSAESSSSGGQTGAELLLWLQFEDADFTQSIVDSGPLGLSVECTPPTSCPFAMPGPVGSAALFDGVDACVVVTHDPALDDLAALSLAAWVQLDPSFTGNHMAIAKPVGAGAVDSYELYFNDENLVDGVMQPRVGIGTMSGGTSLLSPNDVATDMWIHFAVTWDGAQISLWIDGMHIADEPHSEALWSDDHDLLIGCDDDPGGFGYEHFLAGMLDEVRVYSGALTADEIADLANG